MRADTTTMQMRRSSNLIFTLVCRKASSDVTGRNNREQAIAVATPRVTDFIQVDSTL